MTNHFLSILRSFFSVLLSLLLFIALFKSGKIKLVACFYKAGLVI